MRFFISEPRCRSFLAAFLALAPITHAAQTIFSHDFETEPYSLGWGSNNPASNPWTTAASHSPTHSILALNSLWYSPSIPVAPYEFYSVSFQSNTTGTGYFGHVEDVSALYPRSTQWLPTEHVFRMDAYDNAASTRVILQPPSGGVFIDDVTVKRLSSEEAAAAIDRYSTAELGPFNFSQDPNRHQHIPQTLSRLRSGQPLKVLMLGDSIVNDTSHSYFEPLVHRMYPGAKLNVVTRFRNSTGAWFYKNNLHEYVYPYNPDLILFGGISHNNDIESIRVMVGHLRERTDAEIILMSDLAGSNNPFDKPNLTQPLDPAGAEWRSRLYRLAQEEQLEFIDMTQPWAQFIQGSGRAYSEFLRDNVHMNKRGSQLAGRILENYFAPLPTQWNADRSANFHDASAWTNGIPLGTHFTATFGNSLTAPRTITLNKPVSLSRLTFDSPHAYTLSGTAPLLLDQKRFLNSVSPARVEVLAGHHVISASVVQNEPSEYFISPSTSLTLSGQFQANSAITKSGAGELRVPYLRGAASSATGPVPLTITDGTLRITPNGKESSTSLVTDLSISSTGRLDLRASALIVRGGDAQQLRQALISGRGTAPGGVAAGQWNGSGGILSSNAAQNFIQNNKETRSVGYAINGASGFGTLSQFRDQNASPGDLLVAYTRNGDANLDGLVNNTDITILAGFYRPGTSGRHWYHADFNYDGFVDNNDITILAGFYDPDAAPLFASVASTPGITPVPEPAASALLLLAAPLLRRRRPCHGTDSPAK